MKYCLLLIGVVFSSSLIFAAAEKKIKDGELIFLYDEKQKEVDVFVPVGTTTVIVNPYNKPSEFEVMSSTTFGRVHSKEKIKEEYIKEYKHKMALDSIKANTTVDVDAEISKSAQRLAEIKSAHDKAP